MVPHLSAKTLALRFTSLYLVIVGKKLCNTLNSFGLLIGRTSEVCSIESKRPEKVFLSSLKCKLAKNVIHFSFKASQKRRLNTP